MILSGVLGCRSCTHTCLSDTTQRNIAAFVVLLVFVLAVAVITTVLQHIDQTNEHHSCLGDHTTKDKFPRALFSIDSVSKWSRRVDYGNTVFPTAIVLAIAAR